MKQLARTSWHRRQLALCVLPLALWVGCDLPGKPNPANKPELPDQNLSFHKLFVANCAGCHGAKGEFGPAPPLNDPLFVSIVPDEDLLNVIRAGRRGTPMPPFLIDNGGMLTQQQIEVLVAGIKSQWNAKTTDLESPPPYQLTNAGAVQSPDERQRGHEVFARACAGCHGENGLGNSADHGAGPINVPAFLALISDQAIRRIVITGRPDLGMPNYAETKGRPDNFKPLTSAEIGDLVALIASWRTTGAVARSNGQ